MSPAPSTSPAGADADARFGSTRPHSDCAYGFDRSLSSGTVLKFGSALYLKRSLYASFFASTTKCQYFGLAGPRVASVWPGAHTGTQLSRMLSISSVAQVCAGGGSVDTS